MSFTHEEQIAYFQSRVRNKKLNKFQRIFAYGKLRQLRYDEFKVFKIKSKYLFNTDKNDDHYVMSVKNDGRGNFLITPIYTHTGSKEEILKKHNCLDVSSAEKAKFNKPSQIYAKLRDKRYHDNTNFKRNVLQDSNFEIDLLQVPHIENFLYDNKNKEIAKNNRDLKNRWRMRRPKVDRNE